MDDMKREIEKSGEWTCNKDCEKCDQTQFQNQVQKMPGITENLDDIEIDYYLEERELERTIEILENII